MHRRIASLLLVAAAGTGCPKDKPATPAPVPPAPAPPSVPDAGVALTGLVSQKVALRKDADEKSRALTLLNYGEKVRVLEKGDAFLRVQLSDGTEGFLPARAILVGPAQEATLVADQDVYVRPDALGPVRKREKPGVLMFITADRDGWRQVALPDRSVGWVPRDKASTDVAEVASAVALYRGDALVADKKADQAAQVFQDVLAQHPGARLAALVGQRLAVVAPDAGVQKPADAGAASPDAARAPEAVPAPLDAGAADAAERG